MWQEERRQKSFAEQSIVDGASRNARLQGLAGLLDWRALERELVAVYTADEGRPAYRGVDPVSWTVFGRAGVGGRRCR